MPYSFAAIARLDRLSIPRIRQFEGTVRLPGSKSIANRMLLLTALAAGRTVVDNIPPSDDVQLMVRTLPLLGVKIEVLKNHDAGGGGEQPTIERLAVTGAGGPLPVSGIEINLENAGTAFRPLTAVLGFGRGEYRIDGNAQMRRRPIGDLVAALKSLGVAAECSAESTPPVRLKTDGIAGGRVSVSGAVSSQFVSALLLAAPLARDQDLIVDLPGDPVSKPYIDLTLGMMSDFGIEVVQNEYRHFEIPRGSYRSPGEAFIEGDASAASYFLAAGSIPGFGPVRVRGVGENSRQGDAGFASLLAEMGADVRWGSDWIEVSGAPHGLRALDVDMNRMPDAAMTLAVLALFARGVTHIRNIENLRVKESERIRGLHTQLVKLGAGVTEERSALHIEPPEQFQCATIETFDDHRMAMAFSLAAFGTDLVIENPACVSKTYPGYFQDFFALIDGTAR